MPRMGSHEKNEQDWREEGKRKKSGSGPNLQEIFTFRIQKNSAFLYIHIYVHIYKYSIKSEGGFWDFTSSTQKEITSELELQVST